MASGFITMAIFQYLSPEEGEFETPEAIPVNKTGTD